MQLGSINSTYKLHVVAAPAVEEATAVECLDSVRIRDTITERRQRAQEGLRRAGLLPGGQGGREEMEAGGIPLTFDLGRHSMIEHK
jgi:hypothetical protein